MSRGPIRQEVTRGMGFPSDVAFTESVKRIQRERGSRSSYARKENLSGGFAGELTAEVVDFIAQRDSAFLATSNAAGQPYVQHRGGPPGFIQAIDARTLAFPDFIGNRQYITLGNLAENDRAFLFLMNYAERERVKIWGRATVVSDDVDLLARLALPGYSARVEQAIVFTVSAWDANCPQHIPRLVHVDRVERVFDALQNRIHYLEATLHEAGVAFTPHDENALSMKITDG